MADTMRVFASQPLDRRDLFKLTGFGLLALSPLGISLAGYAANRQALKIGVLAPESHVYPQLAIQLLSGLGLALSASPQPIQLIHTSIGNLPSHVGGAGRQMLDQDVDLLVGVVGSAGIEQLQPLLAERQVPLIAVTAGANVPRTSEMPYVFHQTLGAWQGSYAAGQWAVRNIGKRAVSVASLYESGYDTLGAFLSGFEAGGGTVVAAHVTDRPQSAMDLNALLREVAASRPDVVYAAYSGAAATNFLQAYAEAGLAGRIPLIGSAFLTTADAPTNLTVLTALGWARSDTNAANQTFTSQYRKTLGREPEAFAALGYDTGLLINMALNGIASKIDLREVLAQRLATATTNGARGAISLGATKLHSHGPLHLRTYAAHNGTWHEQTAQALPRLGNQVATALTSDVKTGWSHAYLCI